MPGSAEQPEASAAGSADGLFTADDLFGDLVDAPLTSPNPRPPTRGGPVKVQIAEKHRPADLVAPTVEVPAEEMAGLVDAFDGGGGPETAAASAPTPKPTTTSPIAAGGAEVDALLDVLSAMEEPGGSSFADEPPVAPVVTPPGPAPAAHPQSVAAEDEEAQELGLLLDGLSEQEDEPVPEPEVPAAAAPVVVPEPQPAEEFGGLLDALSEHTPEVMRARPPQPELEVDLPATPPQEPTASAGGDLDQMLSTFLDTAPANDLPPASRIDVKFQAAVPGIEAAPETRAVIDLAALADEALSLPLTRPGIAVPPAPEDGSPSEKAAPDTFGPYRLLERIAAGGMAEVFRAKRTGVEGFEKILAVKRILPHLSDNKEFVEMFVDEAKMVAGLTHPNIVQIFDLGRIEKTYFIAMEYVQGKDLRTILKRAKEKGSRIPLDLSVLVISRVCSALEYAHRKKDDEGQALKIVHRDISPQNILISYEGEVKLTDFGIAKATSKASTTDRGALRGKLLYMSPEQASGAPMDRRSDVFSLGVVFYEMITDSKPFLGTSEKGILEMVRECRIEPPRALNPRVSENLEHVVMRALEKNPDLRYQDASEMYRDLERVLHERQPPAASELARFMEALFAGSLPAAVGSGDLQSGDDGIEIDLDMGDSEAEPIEEAADAKRDPGGISKLLKRFGIK
jgi:serine/threonine protein kinase